tara:strand:+ start:1446 stop:1940 length:495 start_codon:yes stop_codon:yes gene_type:complete
MDYSIKSVTDSDLDFVLSLNQKSLSAVSHSNLERMKHFLNISSYFKIMHINDIPVGFIIGLLPGKDYTSENYVWFNERYNSFVYVDRIIIEKTYRNSGLGFYVYDHLAKYFRNKVENILCEVNIKPYNEQSINFHKKYGFKNICEKDTDYGRKRVSYMIYKIIR